MVGRRDADAVDALVVERPAEVLLDRGLAAVFAFEARGALLGDLPVGVDERRDLDVLQRLEAGDVALAAPVDSEHRHANSVICAQHAAACRKRHSLRGHRARRALHKGPSFHH